MAVINIIAKSEKAIYWDDFLDKFSKLSLTDIEIFPIPKELGFEQDSIGVSVLSRYSNRENVISEMKILFKILNQTGLKCFELYDGIEINESIYITIIKKLLPIK